MSGQNLVAQRLARHCSRPRDSDTLARSLIVHKEKCLVLVDWATDVSTKIVVAKFGIWLGFDGEEIFRIEDIISEVFKRAPVDTLVPDLVTMLTYDPPARPYSEV